MSQGLRWISWALVVAGLVQAPAWGGPEEELRKSVVKVFAAKSPPNMFRPWEVSSPADITGSGVVIEGGRILTNAHVVEYAHQIYVQPYESSDKLDATVQLLSAGVDLATLQLDDPEAVRVMGLSPLNGLYCRFTDALWRGEVRLTDLQVDNITSLSFKFMGPFKDVHDNEWGNFPGSFSYFVHVSAFERKNAKN